MTAKLQFYRVLIFLTYFLQTPFGILLPAMQGPHLALLSKTIFFENGSEKLNRREGGKIRGNKIKIYVRCGHFTIFLCMIPYVKRNNRKTLVLCYTFSSKPLNLDVYIERNLAQFYKRPIFFLSLALDIWLSLRISR